LRGDFLAQPQKNTAITQQNNNFPQTDPRFLNVRREEFRAAEISGDRSTLN
jgi:hypothetical protein